MVHGMPNHIQSPKIKAEYRSLGLDQRLHCRADCRWTRSANGAGRHPNPHPGSAAALKQCHADLAARLDPTPRERSLRYRWVRSIPASLAHLSPPPAGVLFELVVQVGLLERPAPGAGAGRRTPGPPGAGPDRGRGAQGTSTSLWLISSPEPRSEPVTPDSSSRAHCRARCNCAGSFGRQR